MQENSSQDSQEKTEDVVASRELNLKYPDEKGNIVSRNVPAKILRGQDTAYASVAFTFEHKLDPKQACAQKSEDGKRPGKSDPCVLGMHTFQKAAE